MLHASPPSAYDAGPAPRAEVVHAGARGRLRARVYPLRHNPALAAHLEQDLAARPGILSVAANPATGTVRLHHDPDQGAGWALAQVADAAARGPRGRRPASLGHGGGRRPPRPGLPVPAGASVAASAGPPTRDSGEPGTPWHVLESAAVTGRLEVDAAAGLIAGEAAARLARDGLNALPEMPSPSRLALLVEQFASLPVVLLGASAVVSLASGGLMDAAAIAAVVAINATIGYLTESQAERTIRGLTRRVQQHALVRRQGVEAEVPAETVVRGDVLVLAPGMFVAADARIVEAHDLTVDESMLTGESLPVHKSPHAVGRAATPLAERVNMLYKGTVVTGGAGAAVVVATGEGTEIGTIQRLVSDAKPPQTPMQRHLETMGRQLALLSGGICGVVFLTGLARGYGFTQMLKASTALAVAAVPEGLPAVATTTLALGLRQMRRRKVLVRRLEAVETLGSIGTVCFDKTGTLTINRMSVTALDLGGRALELRDGAFSQDGGLLAPQVRGDLAWMLEVAALCNDADLDDNGGTAAGSPTEAALLRAARSAGIDVAALRARLPRTYTRRRSERLQAMVTYHATADGGRLFAVKGAPAEVLSRCRWLRRDGETVPLTEADRAAVLVGNERMASAALRVLGVASHRQGDGGPPPEDGLTWLGLVGMADPVRSGMRDLLGRFHGAGIRTVMITGDQSATAYAIARDLDLSGGKPVDILDSTRLDGLDPELLSALTRQADVFARVSPAHKLQIVQGLQRSGQLVAMTGDGINDGPALKAADIGVAMGAAGADVAHELADVVLEDDNIETMAEAVSQGRTIFSNIRKALHFLLATNLSEIAVVFGATALGVGQPLTPMQLLWINLVSDIFPGLALALEPPGAHVMERPPRDPAEPIIRKQDLARVGIEGSVISAGALAAYGAGLARYGAGPQAGTMAFLSLTTAQLLHALSCRSDRHRIVERGRFPHNPLLTAALAGSIGATALAPVLPPLRRFLGLGPLGVGDLIVTAGAAVLPLVANEAAKPLLARLAAGGGKADGSARPAMDKGDMP